MPIRESSDTPASPDDGYLRYSQDFQSYPLALQLQESNDTQSIREEQSYDEQDVGWIFHRHSTIETYEGEDSYEDDQDDHSLSLFYAGYNADRTRPWQADEEALISPPNREQQNDHEFGVAKPSVAITRGQSFKRTGTAKSIADPDLVTWTGVDDKLNPHNWPAHRRWTSTVLIAMFAFIAPMASTMVAPALPTLADEFKINSEIEEFMLMSIFLLAFAIGPFLWGPLSEVFGRVRVMKGANLIFLVFNTACGFAKTKEQMMAFRFLSGIGGSAPQAIGGGVISDCFKANERGLATAIYSLMPFLSPATAPIMGGYMTQYITWRWVFWATSIFDGAVQVVCFVFLRETHHPTILANKAKALRVYTGNAKLHTKWQGPDHSMKRILMKSLVRPWIMLTTQPALQAMALLRGYQYGLMYLVFATFPMVFEESYDQGVGRASLNYISLGIGFVIGLQISGLMQDKVYVWCKEHDVDPSSLRSTWRALQSFFGKGRGEGESAFLAAKSNPHRMSTIRRKPVPGSGLEMRRQGTSKSFQDPTLGLPEHRLPLVLPFSLLIPTGLFIYGWSAQYKVHWIVPNIGTCILSIGLIVCFNCAQSYVVDTYTTYAASATGAAAFVRTMAGFSFPLFAPTMYQKLGVGWGNSLLGFISMTFGLIAPVLLWKYGSWLRKKSTYCAG